MVAFAVAVAVGGEVSFGDLVAVRWMDAFALGTCANCAGGDCLPCGLRMVIPGGCAGVTVGGSAVGREFAGTCRLTNLAMTHPVEP